MLADRLRAVGRIHGGDRCVFFPCILRLRKLIWLDIIKMIYRNSSHLNSSYPEWLNNFLQALQQPNNLVKPVAELYRLTFFLIGT